MTHERLGSNAKFKIQDANRSFARRRCGSRDDVHPNATSDARFAFCILHFELPAAMNAGGIVLCGGKSTRMGASKALLPFGPETMLQRVVRLLETVVSPIVVVAAADQQLPDLPPDVIVSRDEREARGPLEGLRAGPGLYKFSCALNCRMRGSCTSVGCRHCGPNALLICTALPPLNTL